LRTRKKQTDSAYARAGVNIDEMMHGLAAVKRMVNNTATKGVLSDIGMFGGLFEAPARGNVLVASTDGVGTKLKVAVMAGRHDTVGRDLVNHCVNDILVQGAEPLFFLDYLGTARLSARVFRDVIKGLCRGCRENGCALLGGETAEMPGLYPAGEYDLVGTIVGVVAKKNLVTGASIREGDILIGLPSNGLHTNGYSLARKVLFKQARLKVDDSFPGMRKSVAEVLLAPHRSYLKPVKLLRDRVRVLGMAHITGGGLTDNIPRILPDGKAALIDRKTWRVPPVFRFIRDRGKVGTDEMFRVFNMGIGYVLAVRNSDAAAAMRLLRRAREKPVVVGRIIAGRKRVVFEH